MDKGYYRLSGYFARYMLHEARRLGVQHWTSNDDRIEFLRMLRMGGEL